MSSQDDVTKSPGYMAILDHVSGRNPFEAAKQRESDAAALSPEGMPDWASPAQDSDPPPEAPDVVTYDTGLGAKASDPYAPAPERPDAAEEPLTPEQMQQEIKDEIDRLEVMIEALKMSRNSWERRLARHSVKIDHAVEVLDTVLIEGKLWQESVEVFKATERNPAVHAIFRMRPTQSRFATAAVLESRQPHYNSTYNLLVTKEYLTHSLVAYGNRRFDPSTDKGREATHVFLTNVPEALFDQLARKLAEFDSKMAAIFSYGALEGF